MYIYLCIITTKPGNILLDAAGRVKLSDFGTACKVEQLPTLKPTGREGIMEGTLLYMSPESFAHKSYSDKVKHIVRIFRPDCKVNPMF